MAFESDLIRRYRGAFLKENVKIIDYIEFLKIIIFYTIKVICIKKIIKQLMSHMIMILEDQVNF